MALAKLVFKCATEIVGNDDVGLLLLVSEDGRRQLSIVCDRHILRQFALRTEQVPVKEKLLPEVLWQALSRNVDPGFQVIIGGFDDGQYKTMLYNPEIVQAYPVRASDGILLAFIADLPIFIDEHLLMRQSVACRDDDNMVAIPVNVLSDDLLQKALDKAVDEENYEKASQLLQEKRRREDGNQRP